MRRRPTNKNGFVSYEEAKKVVSDLNFKTSISYKLWAYSSKRPTNIPVAPESVYKEQWISWDDYLGRKNKRSVRRRRPPKDNLYMSYKNAKGHISRYNLRNVNEFKVWAASEQRPIDFPSNPDVFYKEEWKGYREFLGIKKPSFLPYLEAQGFVQALGFKKEVEYRAWAATAQRPPGIPSNPDKYYKEDWRGWRVFLGTKK